MQVVAEYKSESIGLDEVENEPVVRLVRSHSSQKVRTELRFAIGVFVGSFVLLELAMKFH